VREIAIIDPVAEGVHRSSNVVVPDVDVPTHVPEIQPTSAMDALAARAFGAGGAVAGVAERLYAVDVTRCVS
jgi:hypothetical protein